jgi:hypothetical protein
MTNEMKAGGCTLIIGLLCLFMLLWVFTPSESHPVSLYEPGDISYCKLAGPYVQEVILIHKDPHKPSYWIVRNSKGNSNSFMRVSEDELMGVKENPKEVLK